MAQAGKQVILCDGDLRRPSVHRRFGISHALGLTSLLLDATMATEEALVASPVPGLTLLPSGPIPPNPAELLGSEPMRERVEELRVLADVVVFDSAALLPVADSSILGALCDGVVLVVEAGRTRQDTVRQAKATLDQLGLKVLGVVLNKGRAGRSFGGEYYAGAPDAGPQHGWARVASLWSGQFGSPVR
jgi:capsular exopolysaccharide synthesis family protein